ncbi:MAG: DUF952 domain-containing protein [Acidimicrobiia bacterium]|jgi:glutathione S-transferase|nr:DUF952 domain-containing protein [Actinomycetota bacterium]NDH46257.1 DUF952 domain-containing protein [Acidimicrobiia bacterium]
MILHLAVRADWEAAKREGVYPWSTRGITVQREGYTHCSFEHQWRGVRERFYADLSDDQLVLLEIDETRLASPVIVERLGEAPDEFPHIYGLIELNAVIGERSL